MLRHKSGCDKEKGQLGKWDDKDACFPKGGSHTATHYWHNEQPLWKWDLGAAFAVLEA